MENKYHAGPAKKLVHGSIAVLTGLLTFIVAFMLSFYIACEVSPSCYIDPKPAKSR